MAHGQGKAKNKLTELLEQIGLRTSRPLPVAPFASRGFQVPDVPAELSSPCWLLQSHGQEKKKKKTRAARAVQEIGPLPVASLFALRRLRFRSGPRPVARRPARILRAGPRLLLGLLLGLRHEPSGQLPLLLLALKGPRRGFWCFLWLKHKLRINLAGVYLGGS